MNKHGGEKQRDLATEFEQASAHDGEEIGSSHFLTERFDFAFFSNSLQFPQPTEPSESGTACHGMIP